MTRAHLTGLGTAAVPPGPDHLIKPDLSAETPVFVRGEGVELIEGQGRRYLDAASGVGVTCLGYGVAEVIEAMRVQAEQLCYLLALRFEAPPTRELADLVASVTPGDLDHVFFVSGGSETNESAFKFARQYAGGRDLGTGRLLLLRRRDRRLPVRRRRRRGVRRLPALDAALCGERGRPRRDGRADGTGSGPSRQ